MNTAEGSDLRPALRRRAATDGPATPTSSTLDRVLWLIALLAVGVSLIVRLVYREHYYFGWDLLGPAQGLYLLSTGSVADAFTSVAWESRHCWYWPSSCSLLYTMIPGGLGRVLPWPYWGHCLTFLLTTASLTFIALAARLSPRDGWIILLGWGAAPELLSFSLTGYASITALVPQTLALWLVFDERLRRRPVATVLLSLLLYELSWQLYESGRLWCIVFLVGALTIRDVRWTVRTIWLVFAAAQLYSLHHFRSAATFFVSGLEDLGIQRLLDALELIFQSLVTNPTAGLPTLALLGVVCALTLRRYRLPVILLILFQAGLVLLLAFKDQLWARRFCLIEAFFLVAICMRLRELRERGVDGRGFRAALIAVLLLGNVAQLGYLFYYVRTPVQSNPYPLPFTWSPNDNVVHPKLLDWVDSLRQRVRAGEKVAVAYNFSVYDENLRDPNAAIERLYLDLGHEKFVESVYVFGAETCRYNCLPIRPIESIPAAMQELASARGVERSLHYHPHRMSTEVENILRRIEAASNLGPEKTDSNGFVSRRIRAGTHQPATSDAPPNPDRLPRKQKKTS